MGLLQKMNESPLHPRQGKQIECKVSQVLSVQKHVSTTCTWPRINCVFLNNKVAIGYTKMSHWYIVKR